jgi:RNA-directed DNA polymerase
MSESTGPDPRAAWEVTACVGGWRSHKTGHRDHTKRRIPIRQNGAWRSPCDVTLSWALLANIFLHLAFDDWMRSTHPGVPFERYADDVVAHCRSEAQAKRVLNSIKCRLERCRLEVHPQKTRIVYCKDDYRRGGYPQQKFNFLGYTFRPRRSKNRWGTFFINFSPAVSNESAKKMRQEMRRWHVPLRSDKAIDDLARMWNPVLRGWVQYFGRFYKSALNAVFRHFNGLLVRWAMRFKYGSASARG